MASADTEICGFLDVKLSLSKCVTHNVKKRSLPWKAWSRQWCSVRKLGPKLGVEIQLNCGVGNGNNTLSQNEKGNVIVVPQSAILFRTVSRSKSFAFGIFPSKEKKPLIYLSGNSETESQQWMKNIRQLLKSKKHQLTKGSHYISIVDNVHSKTAGLTGLHGDLIAHRRGIYVTDMYTGETIQKFKWEEFNQFHLTTVGRPEDVKRICVICTTKLFRGGSGELYVFCLEATKLLQDLVTQGRGPKHKSLSLSEGDLTIDYEKSTFTVTTAVTGKKESLLSSYSNVTKSSNDVVQPDFLNNLYTEKLPVHGRAVDNVYQAELPTLLNISSDVIQLTDVSNQRVSNVSVASGIYEEILEDGKQCVNVYENPEELIFKSTGPKLSPPPLPPRQICGSTSTINNSTKQILLSGTKEEDNIKNDLKIAPRGILKKKPDNSEYIPMSPIFSNVNADKLQSKCVSEEVYVIMQ